MTSEGRRASRPVQESVTLTSRGEVVLLPRAQLQERQEGSSASASPSRGEELCLLRAPDTITFGRLSMSE